MVTSALAKHQGVKLTPREPQPEVVAEQAVRLGLVLQQAGALRPSGYVSPLLRAEWQLIQRAEKVKCSDGELRETKVAFWRRCRLRFPLEVHPSDSTISRVSREMAKRMLCVFTVRSLQFQLTTVQRKRKLAEGLYTEETNEEEPIFQDWEGYLDKLHTLMVAYLMAGAAAAQGSPDVQLEKTLGAN